MLSNLEVQILRASKAYYEGNPIISDQEFDQLEQKLKIEEPDSELLKGVGYGYSPKSSDLPTKEHLIESLHGFSKNFVDLDQILPIGYYTPKYDGASVTLYYKDGELELALTRGDGFSGSDVTDKLRYIVPTFIDPNIQVVSGEWILSKTNHKFYYPDSIAHRNIAVGFLMRKEYDLSELVNFNFVACRINQMNYLNSTSSQIRETLQGNGFETCPVLKTINPYIGSRATYNEVFSYFSHEIDYNIDGVVYESGIHIEQSSGKVIYLEEIAYKNNSEVKDSVVESVEWNHTRTGKYVPIIVYQEIELSGAKCTRASGFNASFIKENKIGKGSVIKVTRSGEVIPYILSSTISPNFELPLKCENCGAFLEFKGLDLVCPNPKCSHLVYNRLYNYIEVVGTQDLKGASQKVINLIIDNSGWTTPSEIYLGSLTWMTRVKENLGEDSATFKLIKATIDKLVGAPISLEQMIIGLGIPGIGWSVSSIISERLEIILRENNLSEEPWEFQDLPGIGESAENALILNRELIIETYKAVKATVGFDTKKDWINQSDKIKVCITGSLPSKLKKSEFFEKYKDVVIESDVKNADYVISNKLDSAKTQQALKLGIKVMSESEFLNSIIGG